MRTVRSKILFSLLGLALPSVLVVGTASHLLLAKIVTKSKLEVLASAVDAETANFRNRPKNDRNTPGGTAEITAPIPENRVGGTGFILLLDRTGRILTGSEPHSEGADKGRLPIDLLRRVASGTGSKGVAITSALFGTNGYLIARENRSTGCFLVGFLPETEILSTTRPLTGIVLAVCLATMGLGTGLAIFISRRIVGPLDRLAETADVVAGGNLEVRTGIRSKDEIGRLSERFDRMIGELDRSVADLLKARDFFSSVIESINDICLVVDNGGRIVWTNRAAEKRLGYGREELIGRSCLDILIPRSESDSVRDDPAPSTDNDLPPEGRDMFGKDGGAIPVLFSAARIIGRGRSQEGMVMLAQDLSGIEAAQQEKQRLQTELARSQKMDSLNRLIGGIAHDFNNILGIILGNAELALDDLPGWHACHPNVKEIRASTLRAKSVVKQLLGFIQETEGERHLLRIGPIIGDSLESLKTNLPDGIDIVREIGDDLESVRADPSKINHVVEQLCSNAAHAMPDGGRIRVLMENETLLTNLPAVNRNLPPGRYVRLSVIDRGLGVVAEDIDRIFEPYFTTKEVGQGSGLGLSVVHGIVDQHGGAVAVDSTPGEGTAFHVYLPAEAAEAAGEAGHDRGAIPSGSEPILLIDDEAPLLLATRDFLNRLGYAVEATTDSQHALEMVRADPDRFQLVITDMTMPQLSGDEMAECIQAIRPGMPIILCSGYSERVDHARSRQLGIRRFLEKPIRHDDMAQAIRSILDGEDDPASSVSSRRERVHGSLSVADGSATIR